MCLVAFGAGRAFYFCLFDWFGFFGFFGQAMQTKKGRQNSLTSNDQYRLHTSEPAIYM